MSQARWRVVRRLFGQYAVQKKLYVEGLPVWAILTTNPQLTICEYQPDDWAKAREIADELNERKKNHGK